MIVMRRNDQYGRNTAHLSQNTAHLYTKFQINILLAIRIIQVLCITNFLQQFAQKGSLTGTRTITKPC